MLPVGLAGKNLQRRRRNLPRRKRKRERGGERKVKRKGGRRKRRKEREREVEKALGIKKSQVYFYSLTPPTFSLIARTFQRTCLQQIIPSNANFRTFFVKVW